MIISGLMLFIAIILETIATTMLNLSDGFKKLPFGLGAIALYALSFYFLSLVLRYIPVGVAYAIWSGIGIILLTLIGTIVFKDKISLATYFAIGLICLGTILASLTASTKF